MKNKMKLTASVAVTAIAASSFAYAQETGDTSPTPEVQKTLNTVTVVAQKREENLQDVPVAITAVSQADLQAKGLDDLRSIGDQSANVTLRNTASFGGSSSILVSYIRGIGQNDFAFNLEPGVGVYVDGAYLARNIGANVDLLDLERVEVLKGPQGTLFGRNTIGGAINVVTRDPDLNGEFDGTLESTIGEFSRFDVRGALDIPLIEGKLAATIAFSSKTRDGYQKRIPYDGPTDQNPIYLLATGGAFGGFPNTNTDEGFRFPLVDGAEAPNESGNEDKQAIRAKLLWEPTDNMRVRLIGDYQTLDEQAAPFSLLDVQQNAYVAVYNTCISGDQALIDGVSIQFGLPGLSEVCNGVRGNPNSPTGVIPSLVSEAGAHLPYDARYVLSNPDLSYASGPNFSKLDAWGLNLQVEYDLTDALQLKSITSYRELDSAFGVDIGGAPFGALNPTFSDDESQFSQELQLIGSTWNDRWNYVIGSYYFNEEGTHDDGVPFTGGLLQIYSTPNAYDTKAYAVFLHNNIEVIEDKLGITVGVRYTHEDKEFTGSQRDENGFTSRLFGVPPSVYPIPGDIYTLYTPVPQERSFNDTSFRLGAEYKFTPDTMLYASYATGYKGGGWTTRLQGPNTDAQGNPTPLDAPTFDPEEANTYELGLKTTVFNNRLRMNTAVFFTEYENIQLNFQQGTSPVTANGGDGEIRGAELEIDAIPFGDLTVDASVGYIETEFTRVEPGVILTGSEKFVNTPKWTLQAGAGYEFNLGNGGTLTPRVDWNFQTESFNDEANTPILATEEHSMVNASLRYVFPNENLELMAGVTNLTDERVIVSGYTNALAIYSATYNRPQEWYLTARYRF